MPDGDTTEKIFTELNLLGKTVAILGAEFKGATGDLKEFRGEVKDFRQELKTTREDVIKLTVAHEQCPVRADAIQENQPIVNGIWTPKKITTLVTSIIGGIGIMVASILTALKWIAQ